MSNVYGLRVYREDGSTIIDESVTITRHRYSTMAAQAADGAAYLADIAGKKTIEIAYPLVVGLTGAGHIVFRSGTAILWEAWTGVYFQKQSSLIHSFIYS